MALCSPVRDLFTSPSGSSYPFITFLRSQEEMLWANFHHPVAACSIHPTHVQSGPPEAITVSKLNPTLTTPCE